MSLYNIFQGYRLLRMAHLLIMPAFCAIMLVIVVGSCVYNQIQTENRYKQQYGAMWTKEYEQREGNLYDQRVKLGVCSVGAVAGSVIAFYIYRMIMPQGNITSKKRRRHKSQRKQ